MNPLPIPSLDHPNRRRLPVLLRRAWYGLNQSFRRRLAHLGLTPDQFTVLRTVIENQNLTQQHLAQLMASDANTVASLLERMESSTLIERRRHPSDRRALCLNVTSLGRSKFDDARLVALELQTEVLRVLPESDREGFLERLSQVADACQNALKSSPRQRRNSR